MKEKRASTKRIEDVWKETLLYNAELRLKSSQLEIREQWKFPVKKQTLFYCGIVVAALSLAYLFLFWFVIYDVPRYISVFSATIQGVSTIFALVAAGTLLLVERVVTHSPRSLSFLPVIWVTGLFMIFVAIVALDIVVMLALPIDSSWSWLINLILVLNVAGISLSAFYVKGLLVWLRSESVFEILRKKGAKTNSKEEASEIISAIRELAIRAIFNHDSLSTQVAIDTCKNLGLIFCRKWKGENPGYSIEHPVRKVAYCTKAIGIEAIAADMDDIGEMCVEAICSMAFYHHENQIHIDEWIFGSIEAIGEALIKKKKGMGCISTLIMEAKVAVDQDKLSLAHWLICDFPELTEIAGTFKDLEAARTLAIGIEILAEVFSKKATSIYTIDSLMKTIERMKRFAKDKSLGSYKGYFGERGWSEERTISNILKKAIVFIQNAKQKAFMPKEGDWPTPFIVKTQ